MLFVSGPEYREEQNSHHEKKPCQCYIFQLVQAGDLTNGPVKLAIHGIVVEPRELRHTRKESRCHSRNTKGWEAIEKNEEAGKTVSAFVTQEIKAKYETHYHDDKEQRKSDRVTNIHQR
jgi:hypothetical protein